jgi:sugar (glycoside-pentoside-hexuronide) transporter
MTPNPPSKPLPFLERISYSSSDAAGQLIFCVIINYLLIFYTDVAGLPAAMAGTILFFARLADAVDAPVWGVIFDKTHSRWGRSRPWFLWLCFPFAFFGVISFLAPDLSPIAKAVYAGSTYIICSILYTGINTPVTSILSALTPDPRERVVLTTYRMFGSKAGVLLVNLTIVWLVTWFGGGDKKLGYICTISIYATLSVILYLIAFCNLKETVQGKQESLPIRQGFAALYGNWPWMIIFSSCLFFWIAFISRVSMVSYYFKYAWDREKLGPQALSLDVVSLLGIFMLPWLCKWTAKANLWVWGLVGSILCQFIVYAGDVCHSLPLVLTGWVAGIITSGVAMTLPFSLLSDSVDYGEWKSGVRAVGLLTAIGAAFCVKAGAGLGAAIPAWILGATGYVANAQQTPRALLGINIGFIWIPVLFYALATVPVLFYRKFEDLEPQIHAELEARRAASQQAATLNP